MKSLLLSVCLTTGVRAIVLGSVRGVVHDPDHRPVAGAHVSIQAMGSEFSVALLTNAEGSFEATGLRYCRS